MRDIEDYSRKYKKAGFEEYKVLYRRKKLIEMITQRRPERILEIGCGMEPLFQYICNVKFTIVEPSQLFCDNVADLIRVGDVHNVECKRGFLKRLHSAFRKSMI